MFMSNYLSIERHRIRNKIRKNTHDNYSSHFYNWPCGSSWYLWQPPDCITHSTFPVPSANASASFGV